MTMNATAQVDRKTGVPVGAFGPRKRYYNFDNFTKLPLLNASIGVLTNLNWELSGTNAADANITHTAGTRMTNLKAHTASADQAAVVPHLDTKGTGLATWNWDTSKQIAMEWSIKTAAAITSQTIWGGFVLTNAAAYDANADNDAFRIDYEPATNSSKWRVTYSVANTDYTFDTNVTVAASTRYTFQISVDSDRKVNVYLGVGDSELQHRHKSANALTADIALIPTVGIQADTTGSKNMDLAYIALGSEY